MAHIPEHGCPKCRINGGFVAIAASLYHEFTLSDAAERLALTAAAAHDMSEQAITVGILAKPNVDGWSGCDEATEIARWINEYLDETSEDLTEHAVAEREKKMSGWTKMFAAVALDVVSGKPTTHAHAHSHDNDDLLGE